VAREGPSPASRAMRAAERLNRRLGHENAGFLSASSGFLPVGEPRTALPGTHTVWDDVAARLPELHRSLTLRAVLDRMPRLPADPGSLPE
jgi:Indoleamine 2,3-dioxygenase